MDATGRIYRRGQWWWMSFRVTAMKDGRVQRVTLREPTKILVDNSQSQKKAWGTCKARLKQLQSPHYVGPYNEKLTVADLLDAYSTLRLPGCKNPGGMEYALRFLREAFGAFYANALQPEQVDAWRAKMIQAGYAQGTVDRIARVLRAAFNLAARDRKVAFVPRITCFNPEDARQGFIEPEEYQALHSALLALDPCLADMWVFGYYSGRRPSELEHLQWSDISLEQRIATIARSKNRKPWVVALEGPLWDALQRRMAASVVNDCIVPWVFHRAGRRIDAGLRNKTFAKARVAAGYPTRIWYDLRRTAARDMINTGESETTVMQALGHTTRAMLDRYGIRSVEDQRRAIRRLVEARTK